MSNSAPSAVGRRNLFRILSWVFILLWCGLVALNNLFRFVRTFHPIFFLVALPVLALAGVCSWGAFGRRPEFRLLVCATGSGLGAVSAVTTVLGVITLMFAGGPGGSGGMISPLVLGISAIVTLVSAGFAAIGWLGTSLEFSAIAPAVTSSASQSTATVWGEGGATTSVTQNPPSITTFPQSRAAGMARVVQPIGGGHAYRYAQPAASWIALGVACAPLAFWFYIVLQMDTWQPPGSGWAYYAIYPCFIAMYLFGRLSKPTQSSRFAATAAVAAGGLLGVGQSLALQVFELPLQVMQMFAMQGFGSGGGLNDFWMPCLLSLGASICAGAGGFLVIQEARRRMAGAPPPAPQIRPDPEELPSTTGAWDEAKAQK